MEIKHSKESGHWYDRLGNPKYTMIGANGKERNTTLRDARKDNLVPSVTTVMKVAAAPGLERWKQEQVLLSALTLPKQDGESESDWINRIMEDSKESGRKAADRGTQIHAAIQSFYEGGSFSYEFQEFVHGPNEAISEYFNDWEWVAEKSFAHDLGFGGKCDLCVPSAGAFDGFVADIKTKEFGPDDKIEGYDEHLMQLAAYRHGLGIPKAKCANVFVSRNNPGLVKILGWEEEDLQRGWEMFKRLLEFYQIKNNHK
jgi:hypothetical protein